MESEDHQCPDCREKDVSPDTLIPNRFLRNSVNNFKNQTGYIRTAIAKTPTAAPTQPSHIQPHHTHHPASLPLPIPVEEVPTVINSPTPPVSPEKEDPISTTDGMYETVKICEDFYEKFKS